MSLALADEITEEALAKCRSRGPNDESRDCHYRHPGLRVHLRPMRSVVGTFETCRPALRMSVYRGRPEVVGARSK